MKNATLESLRISLPYRALAWRGPRRGFTDVPSPDHTPVRITGGIGDLILGLGVAEELNRETGDVVVYSKWPQISKYFSKLPAVPDEKLMKKGFDFILTINSIALFSFANNFDGFKNPILEDVLVRHVNFITSGEWQDALDHHPYLDNLLAHMALKEGYNRETLSYAMAGLKYRSRNHTKTRSRVRADGVRYVTIHDGFDANNTEVQSRAMKTWDLDHWKELVRLLKSALIEVIQIGGPTSRRISGVDHCFVGEIDFQASCNLMEDAYCHIDGDSGLVHAAHFLGVPSIVLFGPTNAEFFGYSENINIKSKYCGDCWWLNPDWLSKCQLKHDKPECMDSIKPEYVFKKFEEMLLKELYE